MPIMNTPSSGEYPRMTVEPQIGGVSFSEKDTLDPELEMKLRSIDMLKVEVLKHLYFKADEYNPFYGDYPEKKVLDPIRRSLQELTIDEQISFADWFFEITIGQHIGNNRAAYKVYYIFKGSPFAFRFRELEDARLKADGYPSGFNF